MQCQSYLPLYYTHNDLNLDANGNTRPVYTGHAKSQTGHFNQGLLNFGVTEGYDLGYDREFMRKTILHQEVTFKSQVQELHRLYRRQKELLDEIKRTSSYKQKQLSEVQRLPNSLASTVSFGADQKAAPVFASSANIATASRSINVRNPCVLDLSLSQNNVARKKPLDLQLTADEFINSEAKESTNNFGFSRLSVLSTHSSNRDCSSPLFGNAKPFSVSSSLATGLSQIIDLTEFSGSKHMWSGTLGDFPDKKKLKMCKDFTETDYINRTQRWKPSGTDEPQVGKSMNSLNSSNWYSYSESLRRLAEAGHARQTTPLFANNVGPLEIGRRYTDGKTSGNIHDMLDLNTPGPMLEFPGAHSGRVPRAVSYVSTGFAATKSQAPPLDVLDSSFRCAKINKNGRSLQGSCIESNLKPSASSGFPFQNFKHELASKQMNRLDSIDLNCSGDVVLDGASADSFNDSRTKVDDLTKSPGLVSSQVFPSSSAARKENVPNAEKVQTKKFCLFDINLPCEISTDMETLESDPVVNVKDVLMSSSSASSKKVTEADVEASMIPVSPEKKECPRPRGESQENEAETSLQFSTKEDGDSMDDVMKIAVDVLISMSSSVPDDSSTNEMLNWFAEVVYLMEQGDAIDEFEVMTLKQTETSVEDYWSNTRAIYNERETCDVQFSCESSKGRATKRVKRRNFQREVLPSLASLSKYEVSEDIQIIESLMETAGTPIQIGVKTRKVGRKRKLKGRKKMHANDGSTAPLESRICLLALPQTGNHAIDLKDKGRSRWEIVPRRPRGKRCRSSFSSFNLSQEGWMKKWGRIGFAQKGKKKLNPGEMFVPQVD